MTVSEHQIDVGDNTMQAEPGRIVEYVWIEGLRRPSMLVRMEDTWQDDGALPFAERNRDLRAVPTCYVVRGSTIYFWPASGHRWKFLVQYKDDNPNASRGRWPGIEPEP